MGANPILVLLSIACALVAGLVTGASAVSLRHTAPDGLFGGAAVAGVSSERASCYKWERLNATAQKGPSPRQMHLSWSNYDGSHVFVAGGCVQRDDSQRSRCLQTIDETMVLNLATQEWAPLPVRSPSADIHVPIDAAEAASAYDIQSDSLIFFGGVSGTALTNSLHILTPQYGPDGKTVTALAHASPPTRGDVPPPMRGAAMVIHGARLLLHGGINAQGEPQSGLYSLELEGPSAMVWRKLVLSMQPSARYGHTLSAVPPKPKSAEEAYNSIFESSPSSSLTAADAGVPATTPYRVSVVLYGGSDGASALSDVWHLTGFGPRMQWKPIEPSLAPGAALPVPRQAHSATAVTSANRNVLVVLGGCDASRGACFDTAQVLDVDTWTWVPVPASLSTSRLPARAKRVAATEEFIDDDAVAAVLTRAHPARAGASLALLPHTRPHPRVTLVSSPGAAVSQGTARDKHGLPAFASAVEDAVVTGYRVVLTLGCGAERCARGADTRLVSILDLDAVCAGSCAHGRGSYAEEFGGGSAHGRDLASEDMTYRPPQCRCQPGFHGRFCELTHECPAGCSGHGECVAEVDADGARVMFCRCDKGFWGVDCAAPDCPSNCNGRGVCVPGPDPVFLTSALDAPHRAAAAAIKQHPLSESHCECRRGFHGPDCGLVLSPVSKIRCDHDCSGHGLCSAEGQCLCDAGFTGSDCSRQCPALCSGRGVCVEGGAAPAAVADDASFEQRDEDFGVVLARAAAVPTGGSEPVCQCRKGFTGPDCSITYCVRGCFGRGQCVEGRCACAEGWGGEFCTLPTKCSGHGKYVPRDEQSGTAGHCLCEPGWGNPLCSQRVFCPHACTGNGECLVLPPVSAASVLLQRPVGRDAFAAAPLGSVLATVNSEDAAIGEALENAGAVHAAAFFQGFSEAELAEMGVDASLLQVSASAYASSALAAAAGADADADAGAEAGMKPLSNDVEVEGVCRCHDGWRGVDCSMRQCASRCRPGQGECNDLGECTCYPGFSGPDCGQVAPCRANCTSPVHGTCQDSGLCKCRPGWAGADCATARCPRDCSGHGECNTITGHCTCATGFSGPDCAQECPNHCSKHGHCIDGSCACDPGYSGRDCSQVARCPRSQFLHPDLDCSGHGFCFRPGRKCVCEPGYTGRDCSQDDGSCGQGSCGSHGTCRHGQCFCDLGWSGLHCELQNQCPSNCHGHGFCVHGTCACYRGFAGESCERLVDDLPAVGTDGKNSTGGCPANCSGNGFCDKGKCVCVDGHAGKDCAKTTGFCADNTCSGHGVCRFGKCHCEPGSFGARCEKSGCDKCEPGKGVCVLGQCQCLPGFRGAGCALEDQCPGSCSGHGVCVLGTCACLPGYSGKDCAVVTVVPENNFLPVPAPKPATNATAGNGTANATGATNATAANSTAAAAAAAVVDPIAAKLVSLLSTNTTSGCPNDCSGFGVCHLGRCFCVDGHSGAGCEGLIADACPNNCGGSAPTFDQRGVCHFGRCYCKLGYEGAGCETTLRCPANCERNGVCFNGQCFCAPGYAGAACEKPLAAHLKDALFAADIAAAGASGAATGISFGVSVSEAAEPYQAKHIKEGIAKSKRTDAERAVERARTAAQEAVARAAAEAAMAASEKAAAEEYDRAAAAAHATEALAERPRVPGADTPPGADAGPAAKKQAAEEARKKAAAAAADPAKKAGNKADKQASEASQRAAKAAAKAAAAAAEADVATKAAAATAEELKTADQAAAVPQPSLLEFASFIELESRVRARGGLASASAAAAVGALAPGALPALIADDHEMAREDSYVISFSAESEADAATDAAAGAAAESAAPAASSFVAVTASHPALAMTPASFLAAQTTTVLGAAHIACGASAKGCAHGVCVRNQCMCLPGFAGGDCSVVLTAKNWRRCPNDCSGQGTCVNGRCFCHYGFGGDSCQTRQPLPCPRDCSGHGVCRHGKCFCEPGFGGVACAVVLACSEDCGVHGVCFRGQCICADGFSGASCRTVLPKGDLPDAVRASVHASRDDLTLFRFTNPAVEDLEDLRELLGSDEALALANRAAAAAAIARANVTGNATAAAAGAKNASAAVPVHASFIDVLSTLSEPSEVSGLVIDPEVRADIAVAMAVSADEHAFACFEGCGAHGRCVAGRCFCEPGFAGALCHLELDDEAVAALEESRAAAAASAGQDGDERSIDAVALKGFARAQGGVAQSSNGWTVPPLVLAMASFCVGVLAYRLARSGMRKYE